MRAVSCCNRANGQSVATEAAWWVDQDGRGRARRRVARCSPWKSTPTPNHRGTRIPRCHRSRSRRPQGGTPHFATSRADDAGGLDAWVPVGPEALLFLWRGYADPAPRARPAPRFDAARRLLAETLSPLLVARSARPVLAPFEQIRVSKRKSRRGESRCCLVAPAGLSRGVLLRPAGGAEEKCRRGENRQRLTARCS